MVQEIATALAALVLAATPVFAPPLSNPEPDVRLCEVSGTTDPAIARVVDEDLSELPPRVLDAFEASGWTITVTDADLSKGYFAGRYPRVLGATIPAEQTIFISASPDAAHAATLHEIGHWLDTELGSPSQAPSFRLAVQNEGMTLVRMFLAPSSYLQDKELFAATYKIFVEQPAMLQEFCPSLYECMNQCTLELTIWAPILTFAKPQISEPL